MVRSFIVPLLIGSMLIAAGCGKPVEYLEEMDMLPNKEQLLEFPLGHFGVPIPVEPSSEMTEWTHGNPIRIDFDLYAVIHPTNEKHLVTTWSDHEANFRDDVLNICRTVTSAELAEPGLSTMKERLTEAARRRLGKGRIRRLVMSEVNVLPL